MDEITEYKMRSIVESYLSSTNKNDFVEIGFYGGSFTGIEKQQRIKLLEAASQYVSAGRVKEVRLSTRPDYINSEILDCLSRYNVRTIELGVQSLDEAVLQNSCRGHNVASVYKSCELIKDFGFRLGIQTMVGLPGDTREKDIYTAKKVIEISPQVVRIYPTLVIKGTYLEKMYNKGEYTPLRLEEAVDICAELLELYRQNSINVLRIGLQPTENINQGYDVVAGPFHPAFRQLVESKLILKDIEKQIREKKLEQKSKILISVNPKYTSEVVGQKRENIIYLRKKYRFSDIRIKGSNSDKYRLIVSALD